MVSFTTAVGFAAAVGATAIPANLDAFPHFTKHPSAAGHATCYTGMIPVTAKTTMNTKYNYPIPANQSVVTETFLEDVSAGSTLMKQIAGPMSTVSGTYNISSTICFPNKGNISSTLQFLTHGIGLTGSYWDFAPQNSYVDVAAQHGYATFYYDRLGTGKSATPAPIQVIQSPFEVAIAHSLITLLRKVSINNMKFTKVIAGGHSFGSAISVGLASQYPDSIDAAILTGFSVNQTGFGVFTAALDLEIARKVFPTKFKALNNGYIIVGTSSANQFAFFKAPGFSPAIFKKATAGRGTTTPAELFSLASVVKTSTKFAGPVFVANGLYDLPYCSGDCSIPTNQAAGVKVLFPKVTAFSTYLAPLTGHALNLHYSATEAFEKIQAFIASNKL